MFPPFGHRLIVSMVVVVLLSTLLPDIKYPQQLFHSIACAVRVLRDISQYHPPDRYSESELGSRVRPLVLKVGHNVTLVERRYLSSSLLIL